MFLFQSVKFKQNTIICWIMISFIIWTKLNFSAIFYKLLKFYCIWDMDKAEQEEDYSTGKKFADLYFKALEIKPDLVYRLVLKVYTKLYKYNCNYFVLILMY